MEPVVGKRQREGLGASGASLSPAPWKGAAEVCLKAIEAATDAATIHAIKAGLRSVLDAAEARCLELSTDLDDLVVLEKPVKLSEDVDHSENSSSGNWSAVFLVGPKKAKLHVDVDATNTEGDLEWSVESGLFYGTTGEWTNDLKAAKKLLDDSGITRFSGVNAKGESTEYSWPADEGKEAATLDAFVRRITRVVHDEVMSESSTVGVEVDWVGASMDDA